MRLAGQAWLLLVIAFLYLPIVVMVAMAFNSSELYALPFDFSLRWFAALAGNEKLLAASRNSVLVALVTCRRSRPRWARWRRWGWAAACSVAVRCCRCMLLPPIAIPWLITGTAMLIFFFWTGIGRGLHAMIIGHVALAIPYVVLVVGTGLRTLSDEYEDAAMSLGATPLRAFFSVTLPLLASSIVAAALFAFAVSLDQFVVSYFLATPGVSTLPVEIYSAIRKGFTPEINAVSAILLAVSVALVFGFAALSDVGGVRARRN